MVAKVRMRYLAEKLGERFFICGRGEEVNVGETATFGSDCFDCLDAAQRPEQPAEVFGGYCFAHPSHEYSHCLVVLVPHALSNAGSYCLSLGFSGKSMSSTSNNRVGEGRRRESGI